MVLVLCFFVSVYMHVAYLFCLCIKKANGTNPFALLLFSYNPSFLRMFLGIAFLCTTMFIVL